MFADGWVRWFSCFANLLVEWLLRGWYIVGLLLFGCSLFVGGLVGWLVGCIYTLWYVVWFTVAWCEI